MLFGKILLMLYLVQVAVSVFLFIEVDYLNKTVALSNVQVMIFGEWLVCYVMITFLSDRCPAPPLVLSQFPGPSSHPDKPCFIQYAHGIPGQSTPQRTFLSSLAARLVPSLETQ